MNYKSLVRDIGFTIIFLLIALLNEFAIRTFFEFNNFDSIISLVYLMFMIPVIFALARNFELVDKEYFTSVKESFKQSFPLLKPFLILLVSVKLLYLTDFNSILTNLISSIIGLSYGSIIVLIILSMKTEFTDEDMEVFENCLEKISK